MVFDPVINPQQDPVSGKWYVCIRSQEQIIPPDSIQACNPDEAIPIIGVWA